MTRSGRPSTSSSVPRAVDPYGRVYDPLVTLGWIAGWTDRIGLGTSIVLVPLHNPMRLAKEVATLQELSGGRFTLGVGMGWHRDEFDFMGVEFKGRGRRADEAIRLIRALWNGERDFDGQYWSFHNATSEPHPSPHSEIWVGGAQNAQSGGRSSWATPGIPHAAPTPTTYVASKSDTHSYA